MKKLNYQDLTPYDLMIPGARQAQIKVLISQEDAPTFIMMMLEIAPGGNTPDHHHEWEEEIFIVSGKGKIKTGGEERDIAYGDALLLDPDEGHQLINTGEEILRFICVIPKRD